jgi:hypothetical protein
MGSFERGKISLDVVLASLKQFRSKFSLTLPERAYILCLFDDVILSGVIV